MKYQLQTFMAIVVAMLCALSAQSQYRIIGFVYDQHEQPYAVTEVRLKGDATKLSTLTDLEGRFEFQDVALGAYTVLVITDYGLIERQITVRTSLEMHLQRSRNVRTDEVVVRAVREQAESPVVSQQVSAEELAPRNLGQDVPFLLKWTPSVVTTSDAGTGIGYTGIRVRGSDATRTNVTINGVPLNDAESQGVFWVDLPDLVSSTESIQIQRGVGGSTFGTGAFGAAINLNTIQTNIDPYATVSAGVGSFGTTKGNVTFGSGLLGNHFTIDGRLSTIQSDGYIDRASADLRSFYGSAAYVGAKSSLRFTAFGGHEVTYQAWNGVPAQYVDDEELRTFNTAGMERVGEPYDNEVDDYQQYHYQLLYNQSIFSQMQAHATMFYTKGKGFFEQYKSPAFFESEFADYLAQYGLESDDAVRRRWLDNDFYGFIAGLHFTDPGDKYVFRLNGGWNRYQGDHFGEIIWTAEGSEVGDLPPYYFNDAVKTAGNIFAKLNYNLSDKLAMMVDLQYRVLSYEFEGLDNDGSTLDNRVEYRFSNPKVGLYYALSEKSSLSWYFGIAIREPNRQDYVASPANDLPDPELLFDNELSFGYDNGSLRIGATGYAMIYHDQLVLTGELNDVGANTRVNVDNSSRLGVELHGSYAISEHFKVGADATFSRNRIQDFTEFVDDWDTGTQIAIERGDVDIAFSPSVVAAGSLNYTVISSDRHALSANWSTKLIGKQFVDNAGIEASELASYSFTDILLRYEFAWVKERSVAVNLLVRNVFNSKYSTNAWNYRFNSSYYDPRPDDPYAELEGGSTYHLRGFYPQSGTNFLLGATLSL